MKIIDTQGDLFADLKPGEAIAHGANCQGRMGAGVAKPIREKFPVNYEVYKFLCDNRYFNPGDALAVKDGDHTVFNLGTQFQPGADAKLSYIVKAANEMIKVAEDRGINRIKTVRLGCGIGGLDWDDVRPLLQGVLSPIGFELEVFYF